MNPTIFTSVFLALLLISLFTEITLSLRQSKNALRFKTKVPPAFKKIISLKDHKKAAFYTSDKAKLNIIGFIIQALFLYFLTIGGGINFFNDFFSNFFNSQILVGVTLIFSVILIASIIEMPLELYKTFVVDEKYGFNKITIKLYLLDTIKQSFVSLLLIVPLIFITLWIFDNLGELWWLWLWFFLSAFNLIMLALYPLYIAPLFNKFYPMKDKQLKAKVEILLKKCGFESDGLFVMNGSLRSTHGNAYFTGFGKAKRIVFFDTLLDKLTHSEIMSVLAHELGHFAHNHVKKRIIFLFLITFVGLFFLETLRVHDWFYLGLGVDSQTNATALLLFFLVSPLFLFFVKPFMAFYSRKNEYEADEYATKYTPKNDLKRSLIKLYRDNAATLTPDKFYSCFYDSHPPASMRINALDKK